MLDHELMPAAQPGSHRLLIALHGLGDSVEGYRWLPTALDLPWLNYLLVDAPDPYYTGYSWYDISGDPAPTIARSRQLLVEVLEAQAAAGFPAGETVLFGFSQGCLMVIETGFRHPQLFAGMVGVSGYVHDPERLLREQSPVARQQRMLFTHGAHDPLIPMICPTPVRDQVRQLQAAGLQIEWREFPKAHTIDPDEEIPLIRDFIVSRFPKACR